MLGGCDNSLAEGAYVGLGAGVGFDVSRLWEKEESECGGIHYLGYVRDVVCIRDSMYTMRIYTIRIRNAVYIYDIHTCMYILTHTHIHDTHTHTYTHTQEEVP